MGESGYREGREKERDERTKLRKGREEEEECARGGMKTSECR